MHNELETLYITLDDIIKAERVYITEETIVTERKEEVDIDELRRENVGE
jgi:hypothetical protein